MLQVSRFDAKARSLTRFFTGLPCPKGHVAERKTHNGECLACADEYLQRWRAENPDKCRASRKRTRLAHPEAEKARIARWKAANPEKIGAIRTRWKKANPELVAAARRRSHLTNPNDRACTIRWQAENPEQMRHNGRRRRARLKQAEGSHTRADIKALFVAQAGLCLCWADLSQGFHVDHIHPLSRGGSDWPSNLQLLCISCNSSKGTKTMAEWKR